MPKFFNVAYGHDAVHGLVVCSRGTDLAENLFLPRQLAFWNVVIAAYSQQA